LYRSAWNSADSAADCQEGAAPPTPIILYECQNEALTKFAIHNLLILKDAILVVLVVAEGEMAAQKTKAGASSRTPYVVVYENKLLTTKLKEIKENLRKKRNAKGHQFALGEVLSFRRQAIWQADRRGEMA
jgi:hypothetical protein